MSRATRGSRLRGPLAGPLGDLVVVAVWFAVLGVLAGVAWWQLAPDITATRAEQGVVLDGVELERQVGVDGWYGAFALVGGLVSGVALMWWRRSRPVLVVILLTLGALGAGLVALRLGVALGPPDPEPVLARARVGASAPLDLRLQARGLLWAWPTCAVAGALTYLVVRGPDRLDDPQVHTETAPTDLGAR